MNANLREALELAACNILTFPVQPRSKIPAIRGWQRVASRDPDLLSRLFEKRPDANVGMLLGTGLIAVDVDPRNGGFESFEKLRLQVELPETMKVKSGGGGFHLVFSWDHPTWKGRGIDGFPGIDLKRGNSFLVVPPSIHDKTGMPYAWEVHPSSGIAKCPKELEAPILRGSLHEPAEPARVRAKSPRRAIGFPDARSSVAGVIGSVHGDVEVLAAGLIIQFPIPGHGRRHDLMVKAVVALASLGLDDATIEGAVGRWTLHFHGLGLVRTPVPDALAEIRGAIAWARTIRVAPSMTLIDHQSACRTIRLNDDQTRILTTEIRAGEEERGEGEQENLIGLTPNRRRLCDNPNDRAFVEALVVHAAHELGIRPGETFKATNEQVMAIAAERHPEPVWRPDAKWHPQQFERLKQKYVARPEKPEPRHELLIEVEKGKPGRGGLPGTPSVYRPTGLVQLLKAGGGS